MAEPDDGLLLAMGRSGSEQGYTHIVLSGAARAIRRDGPAFELDGQVAMWVGSKCTVPGSGSRPPKSIGIASEGAGMLCEVMITSPNHSNVVARNQVGTSGGGRECCLALRERLCLRLPCACMIVQQVYYGVVLILHEVGCAFALPSSRNWYYRFFYPLFLYSFFLRHCVISLPLSLVSGLSGLIIPIVAYIER